MPIGTKYSELINTSAKTTKLIDGTELIKQELQLLLGFEKYTLFFGNNMGLDAKKFMFLRNRLATYNLVKSEIEKTLLKYGRVKLNKLEITFNESSGTLDIEMDVSPKSGRRGSFTIALTLED